MAEVSDSAGHHLARSDRARDRCHRRQSVLEQPISSQRGRLLRLHQPHIHVRCPHRLRRHVLKGLCIFNSSTNLIGLIWAVIFKHRGTGSSTHFTQL